MRRAYGRRRLPDQVRVMRNTRCILAFVLTVLVSVFGACNWAPPKFEDQFIEDRRAVVKAMSQSADFVFVGTVVTVGAPPVAWSGKMVARQPVVFQVERVLKGFAPAPAITVFEPVVEASRLAANSTEPELSPTVFQVGNRLIVFANKADALDSFDGIDENVGVIPSTQANDTAIDFVFRF